MKAKKIILIALAVLLVIAGGVTFFYLCNSGNSTAYYSVIDNSRVTESKKAVGNGSLNFEYRLDAYDTDGNMKTITFKTSRELREGAYIKLNVMPVRGVVNWEEIQYEGLPEAVKSVYPN